MIRHTLTLLVSCVLLGTIGAAPAPKLTEAEKELANLQGTWKGVSVDTFDAQTDAPGVVLTFADGKFTFKLGDKIWFRGTFTIDPSKEPKTIDMTITDTSDELFQGKVQLCLYELKNDKLKWCFFNPHFDRPSPKYPPHGRPEQIAPRVLGDWLYTFKKGKP